MWYSIESRENKGPHRKETQNGFAKDSATRMSVEAECEPSRGLEDGGSGTHSLRDTWKDTVGRAGVARAEDPRGAGNAGPARSQAWGKDGGREWSTWSFSQ